MLYQFSNESSFKFLSFLATVISTRQEFKSRLSNLMLKTKSLFSFCFEYHPQRHSIIVNKAYLGLLHYSFSFLFSLSWKRHKYIYLHYFYFDLVLEYKVIFTINKNIYLLFLFLFFSWKLLLKLLVSLSILFCDFLLQ